MLSLWYGAAALAALAASAAVLPAVRMLPLTHPKMRHWACDVLLCDVYRSVVYPVLTRASIQVHCSSHC
jgi:hypothetical protein